MQLIIKSDVYSMPAFIALVATRRKVNLEIIMI